MSNVIPFKFHQENTIRVIDRGGDPWFVAKDVAELLGYSRPRDAVARHCRGAVKHGLPTSSGLQEVTLIPERDVYRLIMKSKMPEAEAFEEWVVGEVLPAIRKTGSYGGLPKSFPEALRLAADEHEKRLQLQAQNQALQSKVEEDQPKVAFHDQVVADTKTMSVKEAAVLLGIGPIKLMSKLRDLRWVNPDNIPYQETMNRGDMVRKLSHYRDSSDQWQPRITPRVTGKGLTRLFEVLAHEEVA